MFQFFIILCFIVSTYSMEEDSPYTGLFPYFTLYSHYPIENELKKSAVVLEHLKTPEKEAWFLQNAVHEFLFIFKEKENTICLKLTTKNKNIFRKTTYQIEEIFFSDKIDEKILKRALEEQSLSYIRNNTFSINILPTDIEPTANLVLSAEFFAPIEHIKNRKKLRNLNTSKKIKLLFNKKKSIKKKENLKKNIYLEKINPKNMHEEILLNIKDAKLLDPETEHLFQGFHTDTFEKYLVQKKDNLLTQHKYENINIEVWQDRNEKKTKKSSMTLFFKEKNNKVEQYVDGELSKNNKIFFIKHSHGLEKIKPAMNFFFNKHHNKTMVIKEQGKTLYRREA